MKNIHKLIHANIHCLSQLEQVVCSVSLEEYCYAELPFKGIGAHVRHVIEHYEQLFLSLHSGKIDYDARKRNNLYESHIESALYKIRNLKDKLAALSTYDAAFPLYLTACTDGLTTDTVTSIETSLGRELLFVHQHTIHHCAQIAVLLSKLGKQVNVMFSLAPATQHYEIKNTMR